MPQQALFLPCLLERWERWVEHGGVRALQSDWDDVSADVIRNLGWLLNSEAPRWMGSPKNKLPLPSEVAKSVVAYGLPPLEGSLLSGKAAQDAAEKIKKCIEDFEPRLDEVSVAPLQTLTDAREYGRMNFRIRGKLRAKPLLPFEVDSEFDLVTGEARVGA